MCVSVCVCAKSLQLCPTLCDPKDCSLLVSSVHGILQARILEWVAMPSSRASSWPRDQTPVSCGSCITGRFFTIKSPGKPKMMGTFVQNHRTYNTKSIPHSCGSWVIMMSQHMFIRYKQCPIWWGAVDNRGGCACMENTGNLHTCYSIFLWI